MAWSPWRWLLTTYRTGKLVTSSRICRIRAFAAEGFEWVSTTRTWSRLTMTAALQLSMAVGFAIAPKIPGRDLLEVEELGRGGTRCGNLSLIGDGPDDRTPGRAAGRRQEPGGLQSSQRLATGEPGRFDVVAMVGGVSSIRSARMVMVVRMVVGPRLAHIAPRSRNRMGHDDDSVRSRGHPYPNGGPETTILSAGQVSRIELVTATAPLCAAMTIRAHASASDPGSWCTSPIPRRRQTEGRSFGF